MAQLATDEEGDVILAWSMTLRQVAQEAFRQAIAGIAQSGKVIRAAAQAEAWLDQRLDRVLANT